MKAFLLYRDRDFDLQRPRPWNERDLVQDLELETLFAAMAQGDEFLFQVAGSVILSGVDSDLGTILYRQNILKDCLQNPSVVREMYALAVEAIQREKKNFWGILSHYPDAILHRSLDVLQMFVSMLKRLRQIAYEQEGKFQSEGFITLFSMLKRELSDAYFARVETHLRELKFRDGVLISAELGQGNKGINLVLRKPIENRQSWLERMFAPQPPVYTYTLPDRDENGARALAQLENRGLNLVANALAQSNDHILSLFKMLRTELAFYVGCLNLQDQLAQIGEPICFPEPVAPSQRRHSFTGLYDVCLALRMRQKVVSNDGNADNKSLVIITGANQGGKSTFLRSIGLAQLMMQCGMFAPAEAFRANICERLYTHYKREEDATMSSGKLDEELSRMSQIVDNIKPDSLLLFNESFAATNEREGSEIARQIVNALLEKGIKVLYVTHLYEFARGYYIKGMQNALFLRAERQPNGARTFKLIEGEPLQTSFGKDVYERVFAARPSR